MDELIDLWNNTIKQERYIYMTLEHFELFKVYARSESFDYNYSYNGKIVKVWKVEE